MEALDIRVGFWGGMFIKNIDDPRGLCHYDIHDVLTALAIKGVYRNIEVRSTCVRGIAAYPIQVYMVNANNPQT